MINIHKIKAGGLKYIFICAGIGLIMLGSGCGMKTNEEFKPKTVKVPADEMISITWNEGWSPAISVTPGIPIELRGDSETAYDISGDTIYLCVEREGKLESMSKTGAIRKAEERFYWNPLCEEARKHIAEINTSWINIIRKQQGYPTGYVLVKVSPQTETGNNGIRFKADIIASLNFPKQDGDYQILSDKDLKELEDLYKNEDNL